MGECLRFLTVIDNFHPLLGGAERVALDSARALVERGHGVQVLTMRKDAAWPAEETVDGVRVIRFDERVPPRPFGRLLYERANAAAAAQRLDQSLDAQRYDAVLLHPICAASGMARSPAVRSAALIYCFHGSLAAEARSLAEGLAAVERSPFRRFATRLWGRCTAWRRGRAQREVIGHSDAVVCPSRYAREWLHRVIGEQERGLTRIVPWGVDARRFRPAADRPALRARLGWGAEERVVFTAVRLVPRKGVENLMRAAERAVAKGANLRLVIAGEGPLRAPLEKRAAQARGRVGFLGLVPHEELPRYLQAADLFVLPSVTLETFGLVVLESLACGTPVLAADVGAPPEILRPLEPRLVIASNQSEAMAEGLLQHGLPLAGDPDFRHRCRAYAVENYTWDTVAAAFEELARATLARKHGESAP